MRGIQCLDEQQCHDSSIPPTCSRVHFIWFRLSPCCAQPKPTKNEEMGGILGACVKSSDFHLSTVELDWWNAITSDSTSYCNIFYHFTVPQQLLKSHPTRSIRCLDFPRRGNVGCAFKLSMYYKRLQLISEIAATCPQISPSDLTRPSGLTSGLGGSH